MIFPDSSAGKQSACNAGDPCLIPGSGRSPGEGIGYPLQFSWASLVAQLIKNLPATGGTWVWSLGWEDPWRRERLSTPVFWPAEFHGLYRPWGSQSQTRLSDFHFPQYFQQLIILINMPFYAYLNFCSSNQMLQTLLLSDQVIYIFQSSSDVTSIIYLLPR